MSETFEVRDMRHKEKFFVDDEYLNGYAKHLGTTTSMVYFVLCRHADKNQECFPSYEHIADKLGVSDATIKRSIRDLKDWNIIAIGKRKRTSGKFMHNSYILLDKSVWKNKPEVTSDPRSPEVMDDTNHRSPMHQTTGHPRPTKDTHIKDTHINDTNTSEQSSQVSEIIDLFKEVNPSYRKLFSNKTQRGAVERLLEIHGFESISKIISFLPRSNKTEYMPVITTPLQLEDKFGQLAAAWQKKKNNQPVIL